MGRSAEQRSATRFDLKLHCELVRVKNRPAHLSCETTNISATGVSVANLPLVVDVGDPLEYVIHFPVSPGGAQVQIRCLGHVLRTAPTETVMTLERYHFERIK
jgi:hypothetical protein